MSDKDKDGILPDEIIEGQKRLVAKRKKIGVATEGEGTPTKPKKAAPRKTTEVIVLDREDIQVIDRFKGGLREEDVPQMSLFSGDPLAWSPKEERHSMEHPFYSLQKKPDTKDRHYVSSDGKVEVLIRPTSVGLPTIWDKDLLIYLCTLIREGMNSGTISGDRNVPVRIDIYNYFEATRKGDGGQAYENALGTLERLKSTSFKTTIKTDNNLFIEGFSLLDGYRVAVKTDSGKIAAVDVKVCDWLWGAIRNASSEMLSINREYFSLTGGLDRRLYELARKHCGSQDVWQVGLEKLWHKTGSGGELKRFRYNLTNHTGDLIDYFMKVDKKKDLVTFKKKTAKERILSVVMSEEDPPLKKG